MAIEGNSAMCGQVSMTLAASLTMPPQSGVGGGRPEPKKTQDTDGDDDEAHADAGIDDQGAAGVGQELDENNIERRFTANLRRQAVLVRAQLENQAAHDAARYSAPR